MQERGRRTRHQFQTALIRKSGHPTGCPLLLVLPERYTSLPVFPCAAIEAPHKFFAPHQGFRPTFPERSGESLDFIVRTVRKAGISEKVFFSRVLAAAAQMRKAAAPGGSRDCRFKILCFFANFSKFRVFLHNENE